MLESGASIREACENFLKCVNFSLELRPEKCQAVNVLLQGSDVLTLLPTGFGQTSMTFQLLSAVPAIERKLKESTSNSDCPLQSIIDDQIAEARSMGMSAALAVNVLLQGSNVLALLPTGFGQSSMTFQLLSAVPAIERKLKESTSNSDCPLQSIIDDQIAEARSMGMNMHSKKLNETLQHLQ